MAHGSRTDESEARIFKGRLNGYFGIIVYISSNFLSSLIVCICLNLFVMNIFLNKVFPRLWTCSDIHSMCNVECFFMSSSFNIDLIFKFVSQVV